MIDPSTGDDLLIPIDDVPQSISVSFDGSTLFLIVGRSEKKVLVLDSENGEVKETANLGGLRASGGIGTAKSSYYAVTRETGILTHVTAP